MQDIVDRLRSYAPLGDGSLWSQSSRDIYLAADEIEQLRLTRDSLLREMERAAQWSIGTETKRILHAAIEKYSVDGFGPPPVAQARS